MKRLHAEYYPLPTMSFSFYNMKVLYIFLMKSGWEYSSKPGFKIFKQTLNLLLGFTWSNSDMQDPETQDSLSSVVSRSKSSDVSTKHGVMTKD